MTTVSTTSAAGGEHVQTGARSSGKSAKKGSAEQKARLKLGCSKCHWATNECRECRLRVASDTGSEPAVSHAAPSSNSWTIKQLLLSIGQAQLVPSFDAAFDVAGQGGESNFRFLVKNDEPRPREPKEQRSFEHGYGRRSQMSARHRPSPLRPQSRTKSQRRPQSGTWVNFWDGEINPRWTTSAKSAGASTSIEQAGAYTSSQHATQPLSPPHSPPQSPEDTTLADFIFC